MNKRSIYILIASGVGLLMVVGIAVLLITLRSAQLPQDCGINTKTVYLNQIKDSDSFVTADKLNFYRLENKTYAVFEEKLNTRPGDKNYSFCIVNLEDIKTDLGHTDLELPFELQPPVAQDIDQDGNKDIILYYGKNYDVQTLNYLWLNKNGRYTFVEGFQQYADATYDKDKGQFYSENITGPAKAGSEYAEFKIDSLSKIVVSLAISRQVLPSESSEFTFKYVLRKLDANGVLKEVNSIQTEDMLSPTKALERLEAGR